MLFVYKNGQFQGRFKNLSAAHRHIDRGDKSFTVAQAAAEGWEITTKPRQ